MLSCKVVRQLQGRYARYTTVVPKALIVMYDLKDKYLEWKSSGFVGIINVKIRNKLNESKPMNKIYEAHSRENVSYRVTIPKDFVELNNLQDVSLLWDKLSDTEFNLIIVREHDDKHKMICFGEYGSHPQCFACLDRDDCKDRWRLNENKREGLST